MNNQVSGILVVRKKIWVGGLNNIHKVSAARPVIYNELQTIYILSEDEFLSWQSHEPRGDTKYRMKSRQLRSCWLKGSSCTSHQLSCSWEQLWIYKHLDEGTSQNFGECQGIGDRGKIKKKKTQQPISSLALFTISRGPLSRWETKEEGGSL